MNVNFKAIDFGDAMEMLKWVAIALFVSGVFALGLWVAHKKDAVKIAKLENTVALQIMQITQLNTTISEVNAQTKTALKNAKLAETNAKAAGKAAQDAQERASAEQKRFAEQLRKAKKTPACEALLAQDVRKICAL